MGLDTVELVLSVEKIFGIHVSDESAAQLDTVGKLHEFIVAALVELGRENINSVIVFDQLRTVICHHLDVAPGEVIPDARFVEDLGAD